MKTAEWMYDSKMEGEENHIGQEGEKRKKKTVHFFAMSKAGA